MNTPDNKAMNTPDNDSGGFGGLLAVAGGVLVMVACCAGPALIAGGVLAGLGGVLTSPWLLAAGVLVVAAAVGYTLRRRARKATGVLSAPTRITIPAIDGLDTVLYFTSRTLLDLTDLPSHLLVVGGGYVGCEFAQMFRRFGSEVTLIQRADRLLPGEDPDISAAVREGMTADGITVLTGTTCTAATGTTGNIRLGCTGSEADDITGSHLLIATGRTPNSDNLGLEYLGLEPDPQGFLTVDASLRTDAENVWALGDLRGGPMFTHTARDDADIVYRTIFRSQDRTTTGRIVPHAVFTDPEVGAVGLTEPAARAAGYDVVVGRQDFTGVVKARAIGNTRGLVKFVADAATDRILGCHIAGPDGGNLVHEAVIAMTTGATYTQLAQAIHIHPTLAEAVNTAAGGVHREIGA